MTKRWWCAFGQPVTSESPTKPLHGQIKGWWDVGRDEDPEGLPIKKIFVLVEATSSEEAKQVVATNWPEVKDLEYFQSTLSRMESL